MKLSRTRRGENPELKKAFQAENCQESDERFPKDPELTVWPFFIAVGLNVGPRYTQYRTLRQLAKVQKAKTRLEYGWGGLHNTCVIGHLVGFQVTVPLQVLHYS